MKKRLWRRLFSAGLLLLVLLIWGADYWVRKSTVQQLYSDIDALPHKKVGLLLGTSKFLDGSLVNLYYTFRIEAAAALFKAGKIDYILVSGDNMKHGYNEPEQMKEDLIAAGVPADRIIPDYAGFRTLDSILRCKKVFGEDDITIISQAFHNQRALFIANHKGIRAVGFNAQEVSGKITIRVQIREKLARVKVLLDLLFNKQAKFYGPQVHIGPASNI